MPASLKDSCGYQLDLRWNAGDTNPSLVFSYGYQAQADAGNECQINKLEYPLMSNSGGYATWGMGTWHQIAGTYVKDTSTNLATLKLSWDAWNGNQLASSAVQSAEAAPAIHYTDYSLYLGANGDNSQRFTGYLDEIAIFNQPLSDRELTDFLAKSASRPGPSQCRWYAGEAWASVAPDASTATWQDDSTVERAHIVVDDDNWGSGSLSATLTPVKDLRLYDNVYLDATLQKDKAFQFNIQNGDGYCQWLFLGTGTRHQYPIDLSKPAVCSTSDCGFKIDRVETISINSEWTNPQIDNPTPDNPVRNPGPVDLIVHSIAFELAVNPISDWSTYGGAIGPNGWCWRPQAYDLTAGAEWASDPSLASVSANLTGLLESSTRLAADFGDNLYQLPENACVTIAASTNLTSNNPGGPLSFGILDVVGSYRNWDIQVTSSPCVLQLIRPYYSDEDHAYPFNGFPDFIDLHKIRSLGIQKPYNLDTTGKGPVEITIKNITIKPDDGHNCTTYTDAGSCRPN